MIRSDASAPRLRIVTGKGGVGKTTIAVAWALREVKAGRRVLLAEVEAGGRAAALLGSEPVGSTVREVRERLFLVDLEAREAIREYVLLTLRFEALYKTVFENRFVRRFLRLVPALGELVMLGKLWYHEREREKDRPRFDVLILDAPATGHALSMLRTPGVVEGAVPPGPLRDNARAIRELLQDARRTLLHVVTTPEEMPVNEALELRAAAVDELGVALAPLIVNRYKKPIAPEVLSALEPRLPAAARPLLERHQRWARVGDEALARLPAEVRAGALMLPNLVREALVPLDLDDLAGRLHNDVRKEPR